MEWGNEEANRQESARRGAWPARWPGPQRGQTARQPRKGGLVKRRKKRIAARPPQCAASAPRSQKEVVDTVIAAICARFGERAIGLGERGFRGEGLLHARTA